MKHAGVKNDGLLTFLTYSQIKMHGFSFGVKFSVNLAFVSILSF